MNLIKMNNKQIIKQIIKECLVYDIECSSQYPDGRKINIRTHFDDYVKHAIVKWVGFYSYKNNTYNEFNAITHREEIMQIFAEHKTIIGVNNIAFDTPICINNELVKKFQHKNLDVQVILGNDSKRFQKNRAIYMGVDLKPVIVNGKKYGANTLMSMAKHFHLPTIKGDIDYNIFFQNEWTEQETKDIIKYLHADVEVTKLLFDKLTKHWAIFSDWLYENDIKNWKWLKTSIASLTYLAACKVKGVEPTYGKSGDKEEMGGRAIEPFIEESFNIHYMDEASKYPHIFAQFNLFSEVDIRGMSNGVLKKEIECGNIFHGNDKFKVKGYYEISKQGIMEKNVLDKIKTRIAVKKVLKNIDENNFLKIDIPEELKDFINDKQLNNDIIQSLNGLQYAIKIFLNALYGAARSAIFEQIHTPNAGYDCCWIGQQIHKYVEEFFKKKGYDTVGGFTDSWFMKSKDEDSKEDMIKLADECMNELKKDFPFPANTHIIDYECFMDYLLYNKDEKTGVYKKNNYCFISENKIKIVGFPIKKNNASKLGLYIFNKYLEPHGIKEKRLKFTRKYLMELITKELTNDLSLAAVNIRCNPNESYKNLGQLQAQISRAYFDNLDGEISLIKNFKFGKVGKGNKYCTVQEAKEGNLRIEDLNLEKMWNELEPFIEKPKPVDLFEFDNGEEEDDMFGDKEDKKWF